MDKDVLLHESSDQKLHEGLGDEPKMVKRCKVTIGGESYFLISDENEEHVQSVARLVDSQMQQIAQLGHSDDPKRLAVLVALQCASKMVAMTELVEKYQAHNEKLVSLISDEVSRLTLDPGKGPLA